MPLSDPTSGAGYAFGQKLPSSHMTTIATQQVRALDVINGGSYDSSSAISLAGAGAITVERPVVFDDNLVNVNPLSVFSWKSPGYPGIESRSITRVIDYV